MFGNKLHMFSAQPNNKVNTTNKGTNMTYLDLCELETLLAFCHDSFIGSTNIGTYISVQDVCGHINQLKHLLKNNIKIRKKGSPNDLSFKFVALESRHPENVSNWYITLCYILFSANFQRFKQR